MTESDQPYQSVAADGLASPTALSAPQQRQQQAPVLMSGEVTQPLTQGDTDGNSEHHVVHFDSLAIDNEAKHLAVGKDGGEDVGDDVRSYAPSILSSVLTADEISDKTGFFIVCLVILIGDMSRGVFFPTMWPLVQHVGGDTVTLGYAVAAFSFGRIMSSPLFGSWSVTHGYTKTLILSVSILVMGTLLYSQVYNVAKPEFLIFGQTILGVGSGTLGVTRAFVADVTPNRNRTTYMAWLTAVQYAGFTVTPFFGAFFYKIFMDGDRELRSGIFVLNGFTAPAYFMALICFITLILLVTKFQGRNRSKGTKKSKRELAKDEVANSRTLFGLLTVYDACILGCMLLNVATKGSIASFETLGIAFAKGHFNLSASQAGTIVATCGSIGVVSLLSMGQLAKYLSDVQMIVGGMLIMIIGVLSIVGMEADENPVWRYMLAIFLIYSIGYPIGHTAVIGLFSKIVGRRPQGTLLGWFASAGSLARMMFPIMSGYVADLQGMSAVFLVLTVVLALATIFTLAANNTLRALSS